MTHADDLEELHNCCMDGDLEGVKRWHQGGMSLDEMDEDGQVALHHACQGTSVQVVEYVLHYSLPKTVGLKDKYDISPFHIACENGTLPIVQLLAERDDFNPDMRRNSACFMAARHEHLDVVEYLVGPKEAARQRAIADAQNHQGSKNSARSDSVSNSRSCKLM
ncbi:hypothetical protein CYMTET_46493 [Cymbomonas tetramitiformis]|uniref:Uncharacterized protein n=1 Tax=Cymbomonas tetramitiformis TaxID=36881 RepID=A0AAE0EX89_9CHLO|nr:hypothetical protein CYMTET_46493 [Cymbomonas tetramitiformis]